MFIRTKIDDVVESIWLGLLKNKYTYRSTQKCWKMFDIKFPGKLLVIFVIKKDLNILLVVLVILHQLEKITNSARPMGN